ncbi:plant invertase/pectin methylesterase inhibitor [Striga asiatica]|uniref:Pectinesterase n=1 Tax=Striga asiatica TaxID=4170 RepID=A0A5A7PTH1_STRAF|nr:plant invertase/pectin methylesterase inhibitor [Striga asiatica]
MAFQDFDLISQRRQQERRNKIRRRIMIGVFSTVAILLIAATAVCAVVYQRNQSESGPAHDHSKHSPTPPKPDPNVAQKAVKTVCSSTDYKKTCEDSLSKAVEHNPKAQPVDILRAAFSAASDEIDRAVKQAKDLKFDGPFKKAAFEDCLVLLEDAKEDLNRSIVSVKGKDLSHVSTLKPEINNWLSAVLSYQQTCVDGFPDGSEKESTKKLMKTVRELGSNALAIVSEVNSLFSAMHAPSHRKLMGVDQVGYPEWMGHEDRRMLKADGTKFTPNVTVAKDGSGNFSTVNAALGAIPEKYEGRYVIYVKEGVYDETVIVTKKMVNVTMYGDGSQKSIVTGSKNFVDGTPTYQTATFAVLGDGFFAQSLGFRNTAGPEKHQAVALRVQADRSIFLNCRMEGYQDTLYAQTHRQFYRSCYITGTVDFIFGDAAAVFQNCMIYVRRPLDGQPTAVTAQGRIDRHETTGTVLQNCRILADDRLEAEKAQFRSYLGRPWKEYSRTVVMESEIGDFIHRDGWMEWEGDFALDTLYYAEFGNKGKGAETAGRVKWAGYKTIKKEEASKYTVGPFLQGEAWLKGTSIPVRFGMFA